MLPTSEEEKKEKEKNTVETLSPCEQTSLLKDHRGPEGRPETHF